MDKAYQPQKHEAKIYRLWEKSGFFNPDNLPAPSAENPQYPTHNSRFTIIMPPPNAYDQLHLGHAFEVALQDALIRYHRMLGKKALWVPGYDHASIATEIKFQAQLQKQGKSKHDLGRQKFLELVWAFAEKNIKAVKEQLKKLGASCDFSREKFTLDPAISRQVQQTFLELHKQGLVYQDYRIANWDPVSQTTLSDLEIEHQETTGKLYYLDYGPLIIATTRPETIFGDVAVAVNPLDKRYKKLVGQKAVIPLIQKQVPIIADKAVDRGFGTGALKVTPAHDELDYEIGRRHQLPAPQIIDYQGNLQNVPAPFAGKPAPEARPLVVKALEKAGVLQKIDHNYQHAVALSERTGAQVEPMLQKQWYLKMKPLASKAIQVVKNGKIQIIPERFQKIYFEWLENIKDWPVSRQLWWGQRLPVWYCGTQKIGALQKTIHGLKEKPGCGEIIFALDKPKNCPSCGQTQNLAQDPDVFDTWFSSGQWPFNVLGFRWGKKPLADFQKFFPTHVMAPGYEILFFWVARMVMLSLFATKKIPFKIVYLHGLIRDPQGKKMSRSRGNIIEPIQQAKDFGADALRFALLYGASPGSDQAWSPAHLIGGRNFANKLWNLGRFLEIQKSIQPLKSWSLEPQEINLSSLEKMDLDKEDESFLKNLKLTLENAKKYIEKLDLSSALIELHNFTWHEFADNFIESWKRSINNPQLTINDKQQKLRTLYIFYLTLLKALHPFLPFVTESIWQELLQPKNSDQMLMVQRYPLVVKH